MKRKTLRINYAVFSPWKMNAKRLCLALASLVWFNNLVSAANHYVRTPETCTNTTAQFPYVNWVDAATNIQWAVDAAATGETVWVSNGVYVLTNQIVVTNGITLQSTNGPDVTIVNGNHNRCLSMSDSTGLVSGFTFSNGASIAAGGGVCMYSGILSNCYVVNNIASNASGGGIYISPINAVIVTACRVTGNIVTNPTGSGDGGGIYARNDFGQQGCTISGCVISNNAIKGTTTSRLGGGIYIYRVTVQSSMICNNDAGNGSGGGIYNNYYGTIQSCTVTVNQAQIAGGVGSQGGTIRDCKIVANYASNGGLESGGGLYLSPSVGDFSSVYNTIIAYNTNVGVRVDNANGGRIRLIDCFIETNTQSGILINGSAAANAVVSNCTIRGNNIGVKFNASANNTLRNCLIVDNTNSATGGGILIQTGVSTVSVSCCTIANNYSPNPGGGIRFENSDPSISVSSSLICLNGVGGTNDVYDSASVNAGALQYSCVGTNPETYFTGAGIIVADPQFKNFAGRDFRLSANSPCVNAGTNQDWMTTGIDLDGRMRIRYGTVDMGAYECIYKGTIFGIH